MPCPQMPRASTTHPRTRCNAGFQPAPKGATRLHRNDICLPNVGMCPNVSMRTHHGATLLLRRLGNLRYNINAADAMYRVPTAPHFGRGMPRPYNHRHCGHGTPCPYARGRTMVHRYASPIVPQDSTVQKCRDMACHVRKCPALRQTIRGRDVPQVSNLRPKARRASSGTTFARQMSEYAPTFR